MITFPQLLVPSAMGVCMLLSLSSLAQQGQTTAARSVSKTELIVKAPAGDVEGLSEGDIRVFKGIPYAIPPVGTRRWRAPDPMPRWTGVRKATNFGPECYQPLPTLSTIYVRGPMPMSEDCLTLNIWAPAGAHNLPVFFWIHGGSLLTGTGADPLYEGVHMAAKGLIVVSINYRVGVFGWLAHPELSSESLTGTSGNYGLMDQIEALKWVKKNIASFGGDPSNVTIAGESAGALSVMYLMASPPARGLFSKAVAESAYMISTPELKQFRHGMPSAEAAGTILAEKLHAPDIMAMRDMDAGPLNTAANAAGFAPSGAIDGKYLTRQLVDVFDRGEQAPVPLLTGFNSGEIRSLRILVLPPPPSADAYEATIRGFYGDLADEFLRIYPTATMQDSILATTRDALYGWTSVRMVKKQSALGIPSYLYFWDHGYPATDNVDLHGFHASELPYVFGNFEGTPPKWPKIPDTEQERKLSDELLNYWSSFAQTGTPKAASEPDWPAYGSAGVYMAITDLPRPATGLLPGMYEFNEEVMCRRRASGDAPWVWNVGIAATTKIPGPQTKCKQSQKTTK